MSGDISCSTCSDDPVFSSSTSFLPLMKCYSICNVSLWVNDSKMQVFIQGNWNKTKYGVFHSPPPPPTPPPTFKMTPPKRIENVWMQTYTGPRDTDTRPSRRGWRARMQLGRRCVRTSLSLRCGCATARAATPQSGSPRNSRRNWCSLYRPDSRSRTPRRVPACVRRCSSE